MISMKITWSIFVQFFIFFSQPRSSDKSFFCMFLTAWRGWVVVLIIWKISFFCRKIQTFGKFYNLSQKIQLMRLFSMERGVAFNFFSTNDIRTKKYTNVVNCFFVEIASKLFFLGNYGFFHSLSDIGWVE